MTNNKKIISIENTKFIFKTNFAGDPDQDTYGSDRRKANIIIPDEEMARELLAEGFNVKQTKPKDPDDEGFIPRYFISITANYDSDWPPKIYLVSGKAAPVPLDETSVGIIDKVYVTNVNVILNTYCNPKTKKCSLYVKTMYVEQDIESDPFASRYMKND